MVQVNTVDLSEYQDPKKVDYQAMKNTGIETLIIRGSVDLRLDHHAAEHIANAKKYGFNWHLYHYFYNDTNEAEFAVKAAKTLGLSSKQTLFLDMEDKSLPKNWNEQFSIFRNAVGSNFKVGLYCSDSPYQAKFSDSQLKSLGVKRWIASYSYEPKNYDIWQKSGAGSGGFGSYTNDIDRDVDPNHILIIQDDKPDEKPYVPTSDDKMVRQIILEAGYDTETGIYGLGCSYDNGKTFRVYWTIFGRKMYQEDADRLWPFLKDKIGEIKGGSLSVSWSEILNKPDVALKSDLPNLSGYAKLTDIPSVSDLVNKSDLSVYAKKSDIPALPDMSKFALKSEIPETVDLSKYALKREIPSLDNYAKLSDIPSVAGLVKEAELDNYAKKADLPDFSQFAKKSEIPELPDTSNFATKDAVQEIQTSVDSATNKAEQAQSTADANTKALQNVYTKEEADQKYWTAEQEQDAESNLNTNIQELIESQNASNVKSVNNVKPDDQGNVDIDLTEYAKINDIPQSMTWSQITGKPNVATKDDVDYLKTLIGSSSGSGDAGLTIEAIVELIKHHLKAKVDVNSGNLLIDVDGISNGSIADAVATKVAQNLQLKLQGSDLVAEIGGTE